MLLKLSMPMFLGDCTMTDYEKSSTGKRPEGLDELVKSMEESVIKNSKNVVIDEEIDGIKISYIENPRGIDCVGTIMPLYEKTEDRLKVVDYVVLLHPKVRNLPKEIKDAIIAHENVHKKYSGYDLFYIPSPRNMFIDGNDDTKQNFVNTVAYMETGNEFCLSLPSIIKELRSGFFYKQQ